MSLVANMENEQAVAIPRFFWFTVYLVSLLSSAPAFGQSGFRQTIEVGGVGQTTNNLTSGPYRAVSEPASFSTVGVHHEQIFGGPEFIYTNAVLPSLSVRAEVAYLFGHQPTVNQSGGNELLANIGLQTSIPVGRVSLVGHIAPGISSFSDVGRLYNSSGAREYTRVTHFSLQEGLGLSYPFSERNSLHLDLSRLSVVEGDLRHSQNAAVTLILPGAVEDHLLFGASLAHSFGKATKTPARNLTMTSSGVNTKEELIVSWAAQTQVHLENENLHADQGVAFSGSHFFKTWLALDGSVLFLPGGDSSNYQDGGTETEAFLGIKAGVRKSTYGLFLAIRPGLASFPSTYNDQSIYTSPQVRATDFALNTGGVLEIYPRANHFLLRLDLGEAVTDYAAVTVKYSSTNSLVKLAQWRSSSLVLLGAGWRF